MSVTTATSLPTCTSPPGGGSWLMMLPTGTVSLTPSVGRSTRWLVCASVCAASSERPVNVGTTTVGGAFATKIVTVLPGARVVPATGS